MSEIAAALQRFIEWAFAPKPAMTILLLAVLLLLGAYLVPEVALFNREYRVWIILALLASASVCAVHGGEVAVRALLRGRKRKSMFRYLDHLTGPEKLILQNYLREDTKAVCWATTNTAPVSLLVHGVLTLPPNAPDGYTTAYLINDEAWDYLRQHPELIATPEKA